MRVLYLEVCGFRSFGSASQRLELTAPLAVVHADNSQGKTSLAEAVEFLYTGATTRRLLLGGSPSEFQDALRNAHLPVGSPVYVELGLDDGSGATRVLHRELICDYHGASDCTSTLTLDGSVVDSVAEAGLVLSDPPLAAPVLIEHTLRYAVSAKPGERSDYFKAVLEVGDLDVVRAEVAVLLAEREAGSRSPLLSVLAEVAAIPLFAAAVDPLRSVSALPAVERALLTACHAAAPPPDTADDDNQSAEGNTEPLPVAAARVRHQLQARQSTILPLSELTTTTNQLGALSAVRTPGLTTVGGTMGTDAPADLVALLLDAARAYSERAAAVDAATTAVLPLLQVALRLDQVTDVESDHSADCPLCLTPGALTSARVVAIRAQIADQQQLSHDAEALREQLRSLDVWVNGSIQTAGRAVPVAAGWDALTRATRGQAATRLGAPPGMLEQVLVGADALATAADSVRVVHAQIRHSLASIAAQAELFQQLDAYQVQAAVTHLRELDRALGVVAGLQVVTRLAFEQLHDAVRQQVEVGTDTTGWARLAELAEQPSQVAAALDKHFRRTAATSRLRQAAKTLDAAAQQVLDDRLLRMSTEIHRWWTLLRPDELTTFDAIVRRGTGRKYLDVTASLQPQPTTAGVVRNALAVLSNSQLNALGLAAFMARCQLLASPLVVLDDPVPGSDREHRGTFAGNVVAELLASGRQVIVATHDSELARHLHTSHQHLGVDEFKAVLVDLRMGTQLVRTGDDFERLMLDASSQMHSPLPANRRAAGNSLRIAAERLAKHVVVAGRRRTGESNAAISDYDAKNLKHLRPLANSYALLPVEPGQWQNLVRILNDSDHDTEPPTSIDLKQCHGVLGKLRKQHSQHDRDLMRP